MKQRNEYRISRRSALGAGLAVAADALLARSGLAAALAADAPATKPIPSTGERLPVVGLGTSRFRSAARAAIVAEIRRMHELGGTVIDTAAAYGDSEALIGAALAQLGIRARMFIASKLVAAGEARDGVGSAASLERSLERLRTDRIDLLQVHNLRGVDELMPAMLQWKQAGKIRYLGITTWRVQQHAEMVALMRKYPLDFVQVDYSLGNREAAGTVLPLAIEHSIAVLANVPFGSGELFGRVRSRPLPGWAADIDAHSWSQLLLKYVVSHPAVTCAIPGSTQVAHLEDNQQAARGRMPDEAMRRKMEQYWDALA